MTAGIFYKVAVLHVGGTRNKGVRISLISTNGTKRDPLPENYLVAYRAGRYTPHLVLSVEKKLMQTKIYQLSFVVHKIPA